MYRVVQPWGRGINTQGTIVSEHLTVAEAFATIDRMAAAMEVEDVRIEDLELVVVDSRGRVVPRPDVH